MTLRKNGFESKNAATAAQTESPTKIRPQIETQTEPASVREHGLLLKEHLAAA